MKNLAQELGDYWEAGSEKAPIQRGLEALLSAGGGMGLAQIGGSLANLLSGSRIARNIPKVKSPWEMTPEEFAMAEAKGMGKGGSWNNAVMDDLGNIHVSSREHGDLVPRLRDRGLVGELDKPQYRGWVWQGIDPKKSFIDVSDLQKSGGDFYKAYLGKGNR